MKDYNKAFIYKITNGTLHYYGSSADTFEKRKWGHMGLSNKCSSRIITNSGLPWTMEIVEWFPCSCVEELEDREAWYISNNECVNEYLPGACRRAGGKIAYYRQHYQNNADAIKARAKRYRQDNADSINARNKQRYQHNVCKEVLHDIINRIENEYSLACVNDTLDTSNVQSNEGPPTRVQPYQARPKGE
jgi:hypothetical protein